METGFRERKSYFSIDFPAFGPSVLIGARNKVVILGKGYAWASVLWSFEKSKRLESFPTWFILWLRAILMEGDFLRLGWPCFWSQNL